VKKYLPLLFICGALVGLFYLVGTVMPRTRSVSSRATYKCDPDKVFAVVADVEHWPQWNPALQRVEAQPDKEGHPVWVLVDQKLKQTKIEVNLVDSPLKMAAGFEIEGARGNMRYELKHFGDGTILRITEQRDIRNPWRRAARIFENEYTPLVGFLESLGKRLGATVTAEKL
jgi:polyketide cyclase/dehydrase/lipid transport protein